MMTGQDGVTLLSSVNTPTTTPRLASSTMLITLWKPLILGCTLTLGIVLLSLLVWTSCSKRRRPPGPPSDGPFLENSREVLFNLPNFLDWMGEQSRRYGGPSGQDTWGFRVFATPPFVVTHNPECVKHVLQNVDDFGKGPVFRFNFFPILGDGIFSSDHHNWYIQRKTAANLFKVNNFKTCILQSLRDKTTELMAILHSTLDKEGPIVDMQDWFHRYTLDAIGLIAFGQDLGSLSGKNKDFMRAFDYCQTYAAELFLLPGPGWLYVYFTPKGWNYRRQGKVLEAFGNKLIEAMISEQERRVQEDNNEKDDENDIKPRHETILSLFLDRTQREDLTDPKSLRKIRDVLMNFVIAGRDTVAQALSWSVYLLCLHPDVQERVYHEAREVFGDTPAAEVTYEQIQSLKYTHATVTEVLRLYPSVPKEIKWSFRDNVLPDGTRVPKNTWVAFFPYVMGRLESLWPDPLRFDPSRHLDVPRPSSFMFTAFQGGPRICLGQNLAYMQLQYLLGVLLLEFSLSLADPKQEVKPVHTSATLPQAQGVKVRLERRRKGQESKIAQQ